MIYTQKKEKLESDKLNSFLQRETRKTSPRSQKTVKLELAS